ncbi:MAG: LamG domain-containing protein [Deltaproteobacteria bacterium]|nr:LamG domain-containing protein [Deltaproteobacteria bacterium]
MAAQSIWDTTFWNDANLISYYRLEGGLFDNAKAANHYDLTANGGPTYTGGQFGQCLVVNGAQSGTIAGASIPNLDIVGAKTYYCWLYLADNTVSSYPVARCDVGVTKICGFRFSVGANGLGFIHTGTTATEANSGTTPANGSWHQLVGVYDGSNLKIYVDKIVTSVAATGNGSATGAGVDLALGKLGADGVNLNGRLDDVAIFNRALSASEINSLFDGTATPYSHAAGSFLPLL